MCKILEKKQRLFFRESFQNARNKTVEDAEGFQEILFTVEKLGFYLHPRGKSLSDFKGCITRLAKNSDLLLKVQSFENLYDIVREARNDALHQGAFARHLTQNAVRLSLILEDALEKGLGEEKLKVEDFMVAEVICADLWKPVAFIRQQMLANSFSYLPFFYNEKWFLIFDYLLANYLRSANGTERKKRLSESLENACEYFKSELEEAKTIDKEIDVEKALEKSKGKPMLIISSENIKFLLGIITPFDLL